MKRILLVVICFLLVCLSACGSASAATEETPASTAALTEEASPSPLIEPTATPAPTPTPTPPPTKVTVMAVGDLMCLKAQLSAARKGGKYNFDYAFAEVRDILSSADLTIGNLETLIAEGHPYTRTLLESMRGTTRSSAPTTSGIGFNAVSTREDILMKYDEAAQREPLLGGPRINGPETYLSAVVGAGFDVLTNANNHIYDYKADGIKKTLSHLNDYGVYHTGAYAAKEDKKPLVVDVQGIKIGVVAYTDVLNRSPGKNGFMIDRYNADKVAADIDAAKAAGAEFVVVYMHWGKENTHKVASRQKKIAQSIADSGADLILGSHPHCTQKIALLKTQRGSVPVVYSLGNFVSSMSGRTINRDGMIFKFALQKDNVTGAVTLAQMSYIPTYCTKTGGGSFAVRPADAASATASSALNKSRNRTIGVLGTGIASPE